MLAALLLLLAASLGRFLVRHPGADLTPWVVGLSIAVAVLGAVGILLPYDRSRARVGWLIVLIMAWVVLILLAPSFAWVAIPLFYTGLRAFPLRYAVPVVALLTACVVFAQLRLTERFDPSLVVGPLAVATLATAVFVQIRRLSLREGILAERQRLAMDLHDTITQEISSQRMLLQAADRIWDVRPAEARAHLRQAGAIAERNLAEARRLVGDLTPGELGGGNGLSDALRSLADRTFATDGGPSIAVAVRGESRRLPERLEEALLRVAQGALANVREHADAEQATLTLHFRDGEVELDITDNGRGFDPETVSARPGRGHGLAAMRARIDQVGGALTIDGTAGTRVVATVPTDTRTENER